MRGIKELEELLEQMERAAREGKLGERDREYILGTLKLYRRALARMERVKELEEEIMGGGSERVVEYAEELMGAVLEFMLATALLPLPGMRGERG